MGYNFKFSLYTKIMVHANKKFSGLSLTEPNSYFLVTFMDIIWSNNYYDSFNSFERGVILLQQDSSNSDSDDYYYYESDSDSDSDDDEDPFYALNAMKRKNFSTWQKSRKYLGVSTKPSSESKNSKNLLDDTQSKESKENKDLSPFDRLKKSKNFKETNIDEVINSSKLLRTNSKSTSLKKAIPKFENISSENAYEIFKNLSETPESKSEKPSRFKKIKSFLKRIKSYFVYTPEYTDPVPDRKNFQSYAAFQEALDNWKERHLGSPEDKLRAQKYAEQREKVKDLEPKDFNVRLKTFQEQCDERKKDDAERKKLESLKKRTQNTNDSKSGRNLIIGFSIRAIKFVGGRVKATGEFLYTKVHLGFFITPISLWIVKQNNSKWRILMRGKISAASFWFHKPRVQVDLLDLVFLDGCDKSLYVPIPRVCTAPFVLTKNLLWDTRILAREWKTYGQAESAIGVRPLHVIGFCTLFIY